MSREFEKDLGWADESGTERGRSPRGVPDSSSVPPRDDLTDRTSNLPASNAEAPAEEPSSPPTSASTAPSETGCDRDESDAPSWDEIPFKARARRRPGRRLVRKEELAERGTLSPQQRLLVLDTWKRSGLPASDFATLVGVSQHTLYLWRARFEREGPAGLMDRPRGGPRGSRLPEITRRTILLLKESHPEWGSQRISDMLLRGPALAASAEAVTRVLKEAGYELEEVPTRPHSSPEPKRFERALPNQLWQTDLFTFTLKRQNRRVYLVVFLDDHSRFVVGYGLHSTQSGAMVIEVLRSAVSTWRAPEELLTDNGSQYVTWRGKSAFRRELERLGVRHLVSAVRHPETLGKVERFWGTLWRELLESAVFLDLADAVRRIGLWIDHYNFQRVHQGIAGLVPADRFFGAGGEVLRALKARVAANALELARSGVPRRPFYLAGSAGGESFSVHAEGERVILQRSGEREEVELAAPEKPASQSLPDPVCPTFTASPEPVEDPSPGTSPVDRLTDGQESAAEGGEA